MSIAALEEVTRLVCPTSTRPWTDCKFIYFSTEKYRANCNKVTFPKNYGFDTVEFEIAQVDLF